MDTGGVNKRSIGFSKETLAVEFLRLEGIKVVQRNYQCRLGEIDIIAKDHEHLIFLEVKYRRSISFGSALETVTPAKQRKIIRCARHYLLHNPSEAVQYCRFDVIGISGGQSPDRHQYQWIRDAFQCQ